jgi:hypothetical protein
MLSVVQVVAFLIAFVAQFSRIFAATRPFWSKLPASVQVLLPPLVPALAALGQGLTGVKSWTDLTVVFIGCAALVLPGMPSNRSAAPLQSSGRSVLPVIGLMLVLCFALSDCALFGSKLPDAEKCLPTPATLLSQVTDILLAGGDYTTALEHEAEAAGEGVVLCAVKAFLGSDKVGAGEADLAARKRARAYLTAKGAK